MKEEPEKLEQIVDQLVRGQPLRRAPAGLEARVLAHLAERQSPAVAGASRPWWRTGFSHWPVAARIVFLLVSCGVVRLVLTGVMSAVTVARSGEVTLLGPVVFRLQTVAEAASATVSLCELVVHSIPPYWLYGAAIFGLALYAMLFGLGTVAYRSLYVNR